MLKLVKKVGMIAVIAIVILMFIAPLAMNGY